MGGFLAFIALVGLLVSIVGLIKPIPKIGLSSRKRALGALGVSFLLMIVAGSMLPPSTDVAAKPGEATEPEASAIALGQPIQSGDVAVTVESVEKRDRVGGAYSSQVASQGGVYVVVKTALKNTGTKPISAFEMPDVRLIDASGTVYSADAGATGSYAMEDDTNRKLFSDLNPGITVRDADVFEVSAEQFDPATWRVVIGRQKTQVAMQ